MSRKTQPAAQRRERLEAVRREQQAKERRRSIIVIGGASVVALAIVGAAAVPMVSSYVNDPARKSWSDLGVAASAAGCQGVTDDATGGSQNHRDEGRIDYSSAPPSSGPHRSVPAEFGRTFYAPGDSPEVEQLVHNLEHGYTLLWYDPSIGGDEQDAVRDIATKVAKDDALHGASAGKFIAAPWDTSRGAFPGDATVALSHWGAKQGHRQYCGQVSGEVVRDFVEAYPASDAPEPAGA